ncbi:class I SAM-dependent methyltransferase [Metabacillus litoralis]|uniref:class I SAM-dependent methyltransferase n=1 Tax=Metabacillus litoralis TaxID=152268 RepID=UPI001CFED6DF|nr:methyltransferase domain-containing protein [Metabacillus litoralis]
MNKTIYYEQKGVAMTCRSFKEYQDMFMLDEHLLKTGKVLDVASGASSFISELNKNGYKGIAVDPLYHLSVDEMVQFGEKEMLIANEKLETIKDSLAWDYYRNLTQHKEIRNQSFQQFIESYTLERGKTYISAALPNLPFADDSFSLILCNHFLFLYQNQFDLEFHKQALKEMIRVLKKGGTMRIYPLVGFKNELYPHLDTLLKEIKTNNIHFELHNTNFRFLPNATHFLQINK